MHTPTVIVITGGGPLSARAVALARALPDAALIAADSGLDHALSAGLSPAVLIGDLDSVSADAMAATTGRRVAVERHPPDKDATDTELAVGHARRLAGGAVGATELVVLGGLDPLGDARLDHFLGTVATLGSDATSAFASVTAVLASTQLMIARPGQPLTADLPGGTTFSLLTLHGPCTGVSVRGARWPLQNADLPAGTSRGISNIANDTLHITVQLGTLTVVVP